MSSFTFWQIFKSIDDNTIQVLKKIKVGPVILDKGTPITKGTIIAGLDFFNYFDAEIEASKEDDTLVIKSITYNE